MAPPGPSPAGDGVLLRRLGLGVLLCLTLSAVASLFDVAAFLARRNLLVAGIAGLTREQAAAADGRVRAASIAVLAVSAVTSAVWLLWFHRCALVARRVSGPMRLGTGWAYGGWFLPFANLVLPGRVAVDTWRAGDSPGQRGSTLVPRAWWGAFLVLIVASRVATSGVSTGPFVTAEDVARNNGRLADGVAATAAAFLASALYAAAQTRRLGARLSGPATR